MGQTQKGAEVPANVHLSMKLLMISVSFHALTHPLKIAQIRSHLPEGLKFALIY